jgi:hypothetical protein
LKEAAGAADAVGYGIGIEFAAGADVILPAECLYADLLRRSRVVKSDLLRLFWVVTCTSEAARSIEGRPAGSRGASPQAQEGKLN